jgi:hypothetical protein
LFDRTTMPTKRLTGLVLTCIGSVLSAQAPSVLKIPDGTALRVSLTQELSSATNTVDDPVHFEVVEDVKVAGVVAFPRGSTAVGHVVEVEPRRRMGRAGKLNFTIDHVKAPDGSNLRLRASSTRKGEDKTGTVIIGSVLLSPLFLIMRGKDITIPKGTEISAYIDGDREFALTASPSPEPAIPQINAAQSGTVTFQSNQTERTLPLTANSLGLRHLACSLRRATTPSSSRRRTLPLGNEP